MDWRFLLICVIVFLTLFFIQVIVRARNPIKKMLVSMIKGIATLVVVNILGIFTGVTLPVSLLSLSIAAVVGIPGVTTMLILNAFL